MIKRTLYTVSKLESVLGASIAVKPTMKHTGKTWLSHMSVKEVASCKNWLGLGELLHPIASMEGVCKNDGDGGGGDDCDSPKLY